MAGLTLTIELGPAVCNPLHCRYYPLLPGKGTTMPPAAPAAAFEPLHDAHAIEQVTFSVQFSRPLEDTAVGHVQGEFAAKFATELPGKNDVRSLGVAFGPQGAMPLAVRTGGPDGFVRVRVAPTGAIEKEVRFDRTGAAFRTTFYTRWAGIQAEAQKYLSAILSALPDDVALAGHSLQYIDRFDWLGESTECRADALVAPGSRFVAPYVFGTADLWHSHVGAFVRVDEFTKRLLVVNLDCVDESVDGTARRVVRVTSGISDFLNQAGYSARVVPSKEGITYLDVHQNSAHTLLKNVIADILNPEMRRKIGIE